MWNVQNFVIDILLFYDDLSIVKSVELRNYVIG
jgi:hypothetical protein